MRVVKRAARKQRYTGCCFVVISVFACLGLLAGAYFLAPLRTNILLLGIDRAPQGTALGRSDTMILATIIPLKPSVGMLSIPRDLWVTIPGVGENRINTAHFFAESALQGSGPRAAMETIRLNFGVDVNYYLRVRFDGFQQVVESLGGLDLYLDKPMSGYPAGRHLLNGEQSLAFVRDRSGTDDFFRMERGQIFLKAVMSQSLSPQYWPRLPDVIIAFTQVVDTNVPIWLWPRLGLALLRTGPDGIDNRVISREMVNPFTTSGGAQVLGPNWQLINPVLLDMFGQ